MERQGFIGDLQSKSTEQLCEILSRQEKLLNNKRFIRSLPDKGKKISEFVEKVRHALVSKEEEKKQAGLVSVRTELQARYQQAFTQRQHVVSSDVRAARIRLNESEVTELSCAADAPRRADGQNSSGSLCIANADGVEITSGGAAASVNADAAKDVDLVVGFEGVTLSTGNAGLSKDSTRNPFLGSDQRKKPHYIEVVERSDKNVTKPRLRLNQLPMTSASPSPGQSPGSVTPLTPETRRQRDRKHLDDITAARLPPMDHSPAQLLSLEESVTLLKEQTKKHQELQAKLAAQKLAEGLTVSMNSYNPEGGALAAYREVHDDGVLSEED